MTLLEVLLAASLVGLVVMTVVAVMAMAHRYLLQDSAQVAAQAEASFALEHMRRNIFAKAKRIVLYDDTSVAFLFDQGGLTGNIADDRWAGYRRDGADFFYVIPFMIDADNNGIPDDSDGNGIPDDPADLDGKATESPPLASGVSFLQMRLADQAGPATSPTLRGELTVAIEAEKSGGQQTRRSRLQTTIAARGIPNP